MSKLSITEFGGIAPKLNARKLPGSLAQKSRNCKLWGNGLEVILQPNLITALTKTGIVQTIFEYNARGNWLEWTQDVNVVKSPVANDLSEKIIFTGTDKPRITTKTLFDDGTPGTSIPPASYILGIPAPITQPTIIDNGVGTMVAGTYNYVYTYLREWPDGSTDEGPPSVASANLVQAISRQIRVTMSNAGAPTFADYGITKKRIYRISTTTTGAQYQFVGSVAVATTTFDDNVQIASEVITTEGYLPPPDGLVGIIGLPNGIIVGFKDNTVYFSEPYKPHAYPVANQYAINYQCVAIGAFGTTVVVGTGGNPYLFFGEDPSAMSKKRLSQRQPCVSKRSLVSAEFGVIYASNDGLVLVGDSGVTVATREYFSKKEWAAYAPSTIHGASFDNGRYIGFYQTSTDVDGNYIGAGFLFDKREKEDAFVDLTPYCYAAFQSIETGKLYVVMKDALNANRNTVYEWDAAQNTSLGYTWRSKKSVTPSLDNFGFAMIIADFDAASISAADLAAQIAAIKAANQALLASDLHDSLHDIELDGMVLLADTGLTDLPAAGTTTKSVTFRYYADGVLILERVVTTSAIFPMPGGFLALTHEVEVSGDVGISEIKLGGEPEDLGV